MKGLIFKETSVTLSTQDDCFLTDISHLILEISSNDQTGIKIDLFSREESPGAWNAGGVLIFHGAWADIKVTVSMDFGGNETQLLGSKEIDISSLYGNSLTTCKIPLTPHESYPELIVKIIGIGSDDIESVLHGTGGSRTSSNRAPTLAQIYNGAAERFGNYERFGRLVELEQAIAEFKRVLGMVAEPDELLHLALNSLQASLLRRFQRLGNIEDLNDSISYGERAVKLIPDGHPHKMGYLTNLGNSLADRFAKLEIPEDLNNAIILNQAAVDLAPDSSPEKPGCLDNLGKSLLIQFKRSKDIADLEKAVSSTRTAISLASSTDPKKPEYLASLGRSLSERFEEMGNIADINESIISTQAAVSLTPVGYPNKWIFLSSLGNYLVIRFKQLGNITDIDNAIIYAREAVNLTPSDHPDKAVRFSSLGASLTLRFERLKNIPDLNDVIISIQSAVDCAPEGDPEKRNYLIKLADSLRVRFDLLGNVGDLDHLIITNQALVNIIPYNDPDKLLSLDHLGNALSARFEQTENVADIDNAVKSHREAVKLAPDDHPLKPAYLTNLGSSLSKRFDRFGSITDLDEAITSHRASVNFTPDGDPSQPIRFNNLGTSVKSRFSRLGNIADLDNAVASVQSAVNLVPDDNTHKPAYLYNLGAFLRDRYISLGNMVDIDDAVIAHQAAVNLSLDNHPNKPQFLGGLGLSLFFRSGKFGNSFDIDEAIMSIRAAISLIPEGHPGKRGFLCNLGHVLAHRYKKFGDTADIDDAIASNQRAIDLMPDGHPGNPTALFNLGNSLLARFNRHGNITDIDDAIKLHQGAVDSIPDSHPMKPLLLFSLGNAFSTRFLRFQDPHDAEGCISNLSAAATSKIGIPIYRFRAARDWTGMAILIDHPSLLTACEYVVNIMPLVAWLGLPIKDRHEHLVSIGGFTRKAAAIAISREQYEKALEWLEQGRSIVWSQILQLRTPIDDLHDVSPVLAERLAQVSRLLDQGTEHGGFSSEDDQSVEEKSRQYRALTLERESIIDQVRAFPDFEQFLKPLRSFTLSEAATDGPIVVFNIAEKQCDALVLIPGLDDVVHIPLPSITSERITGLRNELKEILCSSGVRMRGERAAKQVGEEADSEFCKQILAELWTGLVKPVVDSLAFSPNPDTLPRIWWCATGPLAFLPIHAAGIYESESVEDQLCNYAISSYIPTISTLLQSPRRAVNSTFKLLSVIQPSAPGASHIPNTKEELSCIRSRLADGNHTVLEGEQGTKKQVMKGMQDCNWLHLACHGVQKPEEPTKSALLLEDGHLTLEEIIRLDLPNAEFAFLSACQTTTGDENLSEEAVHIAGGMLLAGYRGVVATMWSIQDDLAPEIADGFYAYLTKDGQQPDSRKAAEALHVSVQKLRQKKDIPLLSWIPFVHLGI